MFELKLQIEGEISIQDPERPDAVFPGVITLPDNRLLALYTAGHDFEGSDQVPVSAFSSDLGRSWQRIGQLYDHQRFWGKTLFSDCCKPTLLPDGSILAVGYGFERIYPDMGLSDYAEKYGSFPPCRNFSCRTDASAITWTTPELIQHPYPGIEISGPALLGNRGNLHFFGPPFLLDKSEQKGLAFISRDNGYTWQENGCYLPKGTVAPWETRSCLTAEGRIWLVFWAYDLAASQHLNNMLVFSDDDGQTWSQPLDSGIHCQAANLLCLPENPEIMLMVGTIREGDHPGIALHVLDSRTGQLRESHSLLDANSLANRKGTIEQQFANLKFGQPALLLLPNEELLLSYWQKKEQRYACCYRIFSLK